jgi:mannose-6-phosphate isomerase-like protein (cupin superfamily)
MRTIYLTMLALAVSGGALAQVRGTATDIPNADIQATLKATAGAEVSDQQLRVVPINNGEYNVAAAIVHRKKLSTTADKAGGGEHTDVTEIYSILSGQGTLVTGGTLVNGKPPAPNPVGGPTMAGAGIAGGVSQKVGPGDIIIIPPHTPHTFSEVTSDEIVYSIVRVDPHKVLQLK